MKKDEAILLRAIQENQNIEDENCPLPREIVKKLNMNHKRADYILEKWCDKNWYEYGVCLDLGWLTEKGKNINTELEVPNEKKLHD